MDVGAVGWEQGGVFKGPEGEMTGGRKVGWAGASNEPDIPYDDTARRLA